MECKSLVRVCIRVSESRARKQSRFATIALTISQGINVRSDPGRVERRVQRSILVSFLVYGGRQADMLRVNTDGVTVVSTITKEIHRVRYTRYNAA